MVVDLYGAAKCHNGLAKSQGGAVMRNSGYLTVAHQGGAVLGAFSGVATVVVFLSPRAFHKALDMPYSRCDTVESL